MKLKRLIIFDFWDSSAWDWAASAWRCPSCLQCPFFLVTVFCFANSSQKLHDWFVSTKLYKKHLESFVKKKGMTVQTKVGVIIPVTLLMGFGIFHDDAGERGGSQRHPRHHLGLPYHLFCIWSQNNP